MVNSILEMVLNIVQKFHHHQNLIPSIWGRLKDYVNSSPRKRRKRAKEKWGTKSNKTKTTNLPRGGPTLYRHWAIAPGLIQKGPKFAWATWPKPHSSKVVPHLRSRKSIVSLATHTLLRSIVLLPLQAQAIRLLHNGMILHPHLDSPTIPLSLSK